MANVLLRNISKMKSEKATYYSNGKLLLTGEYLVLDGALALGIPTKFGQSLEIQSTNDSKIHWQSLDEKGNIWLDAVVNLPINSSSKTKPENENLFKVLNQATKQNPDFLSDKGYTIKTKLTFPLDWGLGSSSTLINNIAQWAQIDAFKLLQETLGGSGYDIACAQNNTPILFHLEQQKPVVKPINFSPIFKEQLYFVHLNKKQKSNLEIARYKEMKNGVNEAIKTVSEITNLLVKTTQLDDFEKLILEHEKLLASILQLPRVQEIYFKDYFGQIKSLGAWGGDFILATGNEDTPKYFKKKGFETVLLYDEMVLKND